MRFENVLICFKSFPLIYKKIYNSKGDWGREKSQMDILYLYLSSDTVSFPLQWIENDSPNGLLCLFDLVQHFSYTSTCDPRCKLRRQLSPCEETRTEVSTSFGVLVRLDVRFLANLKLLLGCSFSLLHFYELLNESFCSMSTMKKLQWQKNCSDKTAMANRTEITFERKCGLKEVQ